MDYQLVLIAGVAGCYCIGVAMEQLALQGSARWDPETRQRLSEKLAKFEGWLRFLDIAGMGLLVTGILRHYRMLRFIPLTASRILVVAIAVLCLERALRGWATWHAIRQSGTADVGARALSAAVLGSLLNMALAIWVGWWVFTHVTVLTPKNGSTGGRTNTTRMTPGQSGGGPDVEEGSVQPTPDSLWMTEAETLRYTGKDKAYLDLLVRHSDGQFAQPLRSRMEGREMYRRDYLEQIKAGGWPSIEEMKRVQQVQDPTSAPVPKPPQPLTEKEILTE